MKRLKKLLIGALATLSVFSFSLALTGCNLFECQHEWGEWSEAESATCADNGIKSRVCSLCEETEEEVIPALGHTWGEWETVSVRSCEQDGVLVRKCTRTGCKGEEFSTIKATGHEYEKDEMNSYESTCLADGKMQEKCSECGDEKTTVLPKKHNVVVTVEAKAPTCTENGYTETKECKDCQCADCVAGREEDEHYVCGYKIDSEDIRALGHDLKSYEAKAATCLEVGWAAYEECSRCDHSTYAEIAIHNGKTPCPDCKNLEYAVLSNGTYAVKGFGECTKKELVIPSTFCGKNVTAIAADAFKACDITSVVIPDTVQTIGARAFKGTALTSVVVPDTIKTLESQVFADCEKLAKISIGEKVEKIADDAFANCVSLEKFEVNDKNNNFSVYDGCLYSKDKTKLYMYADARGTVAYTAPEGLKSIVRGAFQNASRLTHMQLPFLGETEDNGEKFAYLFSCDGDDNACVPSNVKEVVITGGEIVEGAFRDCKNLIKVNVGGAVQVIENNAFKNCVNLTSVVVGERVGRIGENAFDMCHALTEVKLGVSLRSIEASAFENCLALAELTLPNSLETLGERAFGNCGELKEIVLPDSVRVLGAYGFYLCRNLERVYIGKSVEKIGDGAFMGCDSLTEIVVACENTSYKSVEGSLYSKDGKTLVRYVAMIGEKSFTVKAPLENISSGAFYGFEIENLDLVELDENDYIGRIFGATSAEYNGDYVPETLKKIRIQECAKIADGAFKNCANIVEVILPDTVTEIGDNAFSGCEKLESVNIPTIVSYIGKYAFEGCKALKEITLSDGVTVVAAGAFKGCESLENVTLGANVTTIESCAFAGCERLTEVVLPTSVKEIRYNVFVGCEDLTKVTFGQVEGWTVGEEQIAVDGEELADEEKASEFLTETYANKVWVRSV